jgi:membrane fusion protein, multidrug efflux system
VERIRTRGSLAVLTRLALATLGVALAACSSRSDPPPPPPPEVSVMKAAESPITLYEEYAAQTEAVDMVEIRARVGGMLERQAYHDGATVRKGQLLFVIDPRSYAAALDQARAALDQAQASLTNSQQNLARLRPLADVHAVSQQDLDAAVSKEGTDAANVAAMRAALDQAQLNFGYTTIRAPRAGVVSKALVSPGGLVTANQTLLATLYSVDPIYVSFTISQQRQLALQRQLKRGANEKKELAIPFRIKLADGSEYPQVGKINYVDPAVDPKTGTLELRLSVPNPDRLLRPGEFVRVAVPAVQNPHAMRIPQEAVQELQGQHFVYVVGADNKVVYREVNATTRLGNDWVVEGGLQPGDMIVVAGTQKVRPGAPVKPVLVAGDGGATAPPESAKPGG